MRQRRIGERIDASFPVEDASGARPRHRRRRQGTASSQSKEAQMIRRCSIVAGVVGLALVLASVAMADPPTRTFVPNVPVSGPFCPSFDVLLTPLVANEYGITFSDGSEIITGALLTASG
jgi:hypothetical protein